MKTPLIVLILFSQLLQAQHGKVYLNELNDLLTRTAIAKDLHVKSIRTYETYGEKTKGGKLIREELYSENGNLTSKFERIYTRKRKRIFQFDYNDKNQLIEIRSFASFSKNFHKVIRLEWDNENRLRDVYSDNQFKNRPLEFDTAHFVYRKNETLKRIEFPQKGETLYNHYNEYGKYTKYSSDIFDTIATILPKDTCKPKDENLFLICNNNDTSTCVYYCYHNCYDGRCNLVEECMSIYYNDRLLEQRCLHCYKRNCKGKTYFSHHTIYEYDSNGLYINEIKKNKNGKTKKTQYSIIDYY